MTRILLTASSTTEAAQLFFALLAFLCQAFVAITLVLKLSSLTNEKAKSLYDRFLATVRPLARPIALAVALTTMSGSLYFSEFANYIPCHLCWIQRYLLYPQTIICALFLWKPTQLWFRRLSITLAACCIPVSTYHFLIERYPSLEGRDFCSASGPTCTFAWFHEFGFVTLSLMALTSAATILTLMLITRSGDLRSAR